MFFITANLNYQVFIENKNLISIKNLNVEIESFKDNEKTITGILYIYGNGYLDSLDEQKEFNEKLTFNLEKNINEDSSTTSLEIDNIIYQIVEGRGLELELDFILNYTIIERSSIKEEIVESVEEKLEEIFDIKPLLEEVPLVNNCKIKSRKSYRYINKDSSDIDCDGKIVIKRNK